MLYYYNTQAILVFSSALLVALALQCSKIVLIFLVGLFVTPAVFITIGTRPLSQCYHDKMTLESLLDQFKSENSFLARRTYPDK